MQKNLMVRIPEKLYREVTEIRKREQLTLKSVVFAALRAWVMTHKKLKINE